MPSSTRAIFYARENLQKAYYDLGYTSFSKKQITLFVKNVLRINFLYCPTTRWAWLKLVVLDRYRIQKGSGAKISNEIPQERHSVRVFNRLRATSYCCRNLGTQLTKAQPEAEFLDVIGTNIVYGNLKSENYQDCVISHRYNNILKHWIIEIRIKSDQLINKIFILPVGCGAVNLHVSYTYYGPKFLMGSFGRPFKGRVTGRCTRTIQDRNYPRLNL